MPEKLDALFLHAPSRHVYNVLPMGFLAMCDTLEKHGFKARIMNIGVEEFLSPGFSPRDIFDRYSPRVVGIDLHWFVNSYSSLELAREIRKHFAGPILLGGYTAGFFHEDILNNHDFISGVVAGEGETAILSYLRRMDAGDFDKVPNLCRRAPDGIVKNSRDAAPAEMLDEQNCARLGFLDHWEEYVSTSAGFGPVIMIYPRKVPKRAFYLPLGRGCSVSCSYCTAAVSSTRLMMNRARPYYRPVDKIVADFIELKSAGIDTVCIEFHPYKPDEGFYLELFERLRVEKLDMGINFGCWSLPSKELIRAVAAAFVRDKTCLSLSPESGSERVRDLNKGASYSDAAFFDVVGMIKDSGLRASCHFAFGFPGETPDDFDATLRMFRRLKNTGFYLSIRGLQLEPGSPMYLDPDRFGIVRYRNNFDDYHEYCRELHENRVPAHPFGYRTERFSEARLSGLKIRAYRAFYLRPGFVFERLRWTKNARQGSSDAVKIGLAALLARRDMLNRWER